METFYTWSKLLTDTTELLFTCLSIAYIIANNRRIGQASNFPCNIILQLTMMFVQSALFVSVDIYQLVTGIRGYSEMNQSVYVLNLLAGASFTMQHALFVS